MARAARRATARSGQRRRTRHEPQIPHEPQGTPSVAEIQREPNRLIRFFKILGPGFVTGASDDDPSGIATYATSGAKLGFPILWVAPLISGDRRIIGTRTNNRLSTVLGWLTAAAMLAAAIVVVVTTVTG